MFLPPPSQAQMPRPSSADPQQARVAQQAPYPLGGGMAQSMMLPNQGQPGQRAQTLARAGARRLDEGQAAKLLAGGF